MSVSAANTKPSVLLTIGDASSASGVSAKMIRYYESQHLLPVIRRTDAGYRQYSDDDINTLRFIRRARDLGFSMEEVATLLSLWRDRHRASREVKRIALKHVADLQQRIDAMTAMQRSLQHLAHQCHGNQRPACPILDDLAAGPANQSNRIDQTDMRGDHFPTVGKPHPGL